MKTRALRPFVWLGLFILIVSLACTLGAQPTQAPASPTQAPIATTETQPPAAKPTTPAEPTAPPAASSGAISSREDVQKAVIRIVSQGSFVDPEFGSYEGIGSGSGFIIDPSGIAVTNNHVVTGAALIKVYFSDNPNKAYNAKILGVSECSDLAVIDIDGEGFPYLQWRGGDVKAGTQVWSAGYPLGDPEFSIHRGVVSKEHSSGETSWASVDSVLEHDATINPGNSGGPLVDDNGQVVGINYASSVQATNQFYAIAQAEADPILKELETGTNVNSIGINGTAVVSDDGTISGIWISNVASGSPADWAGIKGGDIVLEMEGVQMGRDGTMADYCDILRTHKSTDTLSVKVLRFSAGELLEGQLNGREMSVTGTFDTTGSTGDTSGNTSGTAQSVSDDFSSDVGNWEIFDGAQITGGIFYLGQFTDCADVGSDNAFGCFTQCLTCGYTSTYDMQVDAAYVDGVTDRTFGMVLRFIDNNDNGLVDSDDYYLDFELSIYDKYFIIWEHNTDGKWYVIDQKNATAIKAGRKVNTLRAIASNGGTDVDIYINDEWVDGIQSIPYPEGSVGLVVGGRAMQAAFDNFYFTVQ
ncbi:MAG: trypsin-like peptidase domain-containing protein [Chloroflexi bacterium]|nr:trypsin-like peptidase domain-containing protein [Chloroflexota bacterium]